MSALASEGVTMRRRLIAAAIAIAAIAAPAAAMAASAAPASPVAATPYSYYHA